MNRANHFETRIPSRYAGECPMEERIDALSDTRHHILGSLIAPALMAGEKPEEYNAPVLDPAAEQLAVIEANLAAQPKAQELAQNEYDFLAKQIRQGLSKAIPGYYNIIKNQSAVVQQQLKGEVPEDVQRQIQRNAASRNIYGGFGRGSGAGQNLEARDLGLQSMQITNLGLRNASALIDQQAKYLPGPQGAGAMFWSPQQWFQNKFAERNFQMGVFERNAAIRAAPDPLAYAYGQGLLNVESQLMSVAGAVVGAYTGGMAGGSMGENTNAGGLGMTGTMSGGSQTFSSSGQTGQGWGTLSSGNPQIGY